MSKLCIISLIACVAVVSCDKSTPCDEAAANKYLVPDDVERCQTDACVEYVIRRAADAEKRCEEYRKNDVRN